MIHFCFGNGNSREGIDIEQYKKYGTVVGCNAIYRDYTPDILVSLDSKMSHEIYRSGYCFENTTWLGDWTSIPSVVAENMLLEQKGIIDFEFKGCPEAVYHYDNVENTTYITGIKEDKVRNIEPNINDIAYGTGNKSIYLSCEMEADEVYIIGHDLELDNNIYAGTNAYAQHTTDTLVPKAWTLQHKITFDTFKFTKFYKVSSNNIEIEEWKECENLEYITLKQLDEKFKI
jgi:hypothetical protein|tara:strand:+ start:499 stop:1191 length:693 start_codon:yes stop_codon:yes gene_type:complete